MSLLDAFLPGARLRQVDHVAVATGADETWDAVQAMDLYEVGLVRRLFELRTLPERALARLRGAQVEPAVRHLHLAEVGAQPHGFLELGRAQRTLAFGAVGHFWQPEITWASVTPATFAAFDEPGWGKVAWSVRVDPREHGGSWITIEVRVTATDEDAWHRFRRYWVVIGQFSHAIRRILLGHFKKALGEPAPHGLPGDEILCCARFERTHSRFIEVPPAQVWPWLVQMGCRRGGWYSFDELDNGGRPSADHIIDELQDLEVGDLIPAKPTGPDAFAVLRLEPARALVIGSPSLLPEDEDGENVATGLEEPYRATWAFVLEPIGDVATDLRVRVRADYRPSLKMAVVRALLGAAHEAMERKQLHTLKQRAERAGASALH